MTFTDPATTSTFADSYREARIPATGPIDTRPIAMTPADREMFDPIWRAVLPETRARSNDIHLPISLAYAERLCAAHPEADAEVVLVATLLHDTGWGRVDESRIISEGFAGDWRKARIRYEHEHQGCEIAREVLPPLGYSNDFVERVTAIIDGHDTRPFAYSLEDALMRDADRLWRFDQVGIALASSWFGTDPTSYVDRLRIEIVPELISQAGYEMALADLERSAQLLRTEALRPESVRKDAQ